MSKWTKANEYVPVTKGSTAVITLQSDGDVYGYMDAGTTRVLLASASAGMTKVPTGSFSKITCTAPFILTTESAMSRLHGGQGGTSGGGGSTGNDWITVNDAGEAVLNFPDETNPLIENIKLAYNDFTKITGTTGGKTDCSNLFWYARMQEVDIIIPNSTDCSSFVRNCSSLTQAKAQILGNTRLGAAFYGCNNLENIIVISDDASILQNLVGGCPKLTSFTFSFSSFASLDFTLSSGFGSLGNLTTLENVTVLEGGLASCTSFIITNSTNLTDTSIQNIIDALPDYSGTETSALVSFPPDRLTTEQQEQLTSKGWTWS